MSDIKVSYSKLYENYNNVTTNINYLIKVVENINSECQKLSGCWEGRLSEQFLSFSNKMNGFANLTILNFKNTEEYKRAAIDMFKSNENDISNLFSLSPLAMALNPNNKIAKGNYSILSKLNDAGVLDYDTKYKYLKENNKDLPDSEFIVDILFRNPDFSYVGVDTYGEDDVYVLKSGENSGTVTISKDFGKLDDVELDIVLNSINYMPNSLRESTPMIYITENNSSTDAQAGEYYGIDNFVSAGEADNVNVRLFGPAFIPGNEEEAIGVLYHELAHNYDMNGISFTISESSEWKQAVKLDDNWASDYAHTAYNNLPEGSKYCEDFADSIRNLYNMGGEEFKNQYPARAKILESEFPEMFESDFPSLQKSYERESLESDSDGLG